MIETVVLSAFQENLAACFHWAKVHPDTLTYWRRAANIRWNAKKTTTINAKLLMTGLMYRPRVTGRFASEEEKLIALRRKLGSLYSQNKEEIARAFILGMTFDSIRIDRPVAAEDLAGAIVQAGGFHRSPRTLKRYAAILSNRFNRVIEYPRERPYEPELATAFARLSLERWSNQRQAGLDRRKAS